MVLRETNAILYIQNLKEVIIKVIELSETNQKPKPLQLLILLTFLLHTLYDLVFQEKKTIPYTMPTFINLCTLPKVLSLPETPITMCLMGGMRSHPSNSTSNGTSSQSPLISPGPQQLPQCAHSIFIYNCSNIFHIVL